MDLRAAGPIEKAVNELPSVIFMLEHEHLHISDCHWDRVPKVNSLGYNVPAK